MSDNRSFQECANPECAKRRLEMALANGIATRRYEAAIAAHELRWKMLKGHLWSAIGVHALVQQAEADVPIPKTGD